MNALEESLQGSWLRVGAGVGADIPAGTGLDDMRSLEPAEPGFDLLMIDTEAGLGRGFSWSTQHAESCAGSRSVADGVQEEDRSHRQPEGVDVGPQARAFACAGPWIVLLSF